jgi:hypothetical protein
MRNPIRCYAVTAGSVSPLIVMGIGRRPLVSEDQGGELFVNFNRFDVATKELIEADPAAWVRMLGIGSGKGAKLIDSGITTLTASADKVIEVPGRKRFLLTLELKASHDAGLLRSLCFRQAALEYQHDLAVLSVLLLLRKDANKPSLTGAFSRWLSDEEFSTRYNYRVMRLWQQRPEPFLSAGAALAPLAPLTDVKPDAVPALVKRVAQRIRGAGGEKVEKLSLATYVLMGLRYSEAVSALLVKEFPKMQESVTYQKILREGRTEGRIEGRTEGEIAEARRMLLRQGTEVFGEPDARTKKAIESIEDVERLEALGVRLVRGGSKTWRQWLSGK